MHSLYVENFIFLMNLSSVLPPVSDVYVLFSLYILQTLKLLIMNKYQLLLVKSLSCSNREVFFVVYFSSNHILMLPTFNWLCCITFCSLKLMIYLKVCLFIFGRIIMKRCRFINLLMNDNGEKFNTNMGPLLPDCLMVMFHRGAIIHTLWL